MEDLKETKKNAQILMDKILEVLQKISEIKINEKNINHIISFYLHFSLLSKYYYNFLFDLEKFFLNNKENEEIKNNHKEFIQQYSLIEQICKLLENKKINKILFETKEGGEDFAPKPLMELPDFFEQHKMQFEKWVKTKPTKEKLIKTLELWTGSKGEASIVSTLNLLKNSSKHLILHIAQVYGLRFKFNNELDNFYSQSFQSLLNYYVEHRNKYIGNTFYSQKLEFGKTNKFHIKDNFLILSIEFKKCNFSSFKSVIMKIIEALNKLDYFIIKEMSKEVLENIDEFVHIEDFLPSNANFLARKQIKKEIVEAAEICNESLECIETPSISLSISGEYSIESILQNVKEFLIVKKEALNHINEISDMFELQSENIRFLKEKLDFLTGPSIEPCIKRIFYHLASLIIFEKKNIDYDKSEWEELLDFKWKNLVTKDGRFLSKDYDNLIKHVFC